MTLSAPPDLSTLPDPHEVLLPSRAYLLAWRQQTLPARRLALTDAETHFDEASSAEDASYRDMALLGLIGDALQPLEDVAYIGTAYENAISGVPNYVTGTVYSRTRPTTFYTSLKNWPDERWMVLAGLRGRDSATRRAIPLIEGLGIAERYSEADLAAVAEAEEATLKLLKPYVLHLAHTWRQFSRYFHAFKHGGTLISRQDFTLYDDDGEERLPSIAIWWGSKKTANEQGLGDTNLKPEHVAHEVRRSGHLALDVAHFLVDARLPDA